jgi:hypothetical protein
MKLTRTLLALGLFGIAFGYVEAAVVAYLRTIYGPIRQATFPTMPHGDLFPLLRIADDVRAFRKMVRQCVPGRTIDVCYLEWGIFAKEPGQQSLANALFTADCLGQFHLAQVAIACNYNFQEKIFGLIPGWCVAEGWGGNPWNGVTIRPKALVLAGGTLAAQGSLAAAESVLGGGRSCRTG